MRYQPVTKALISTFILFNTAMILLVHRAPIRNVIIPAGMAQDLTDELFRPIDRNWWWLSWYSYLSGTDLLAVMFTTLSRTEWSFQISAVYADGSTRLLFPSRNDRTFLQRTFVDSKEGKFLNNLYGNEYWRKQYAHFLCRRSRLSGETEQSIQFEVTWKPYRSRAEAFRAGYHLSGPESQYPLGVFPCP